MKELVAAAWDAEMMAYAQEALHWEELAQDKRAAFSSYAARNEFALAKERLSEAEYYEEFLGEARTGLRYARLAGAKENLLSKDVAEHLRVIEGYYSRSAQAAADDRRGAKSMSVTPSTPIQRRAEMWEGALDAWCAVNDANTFPLEYGRDPTRPHAPLQ